MKMEGVHLAPHNQAGGPGLDGTTRPKPNNRIIVLGNASLENQR